MHNFLYSLTICLLHYYPRHVSSINMPIFKRKNCIHTSSGIFALCKRLHSTLVESVYWADVYRERRYQMMCEYNFSSWRWACWCSKHVDDNNVTNILLTNKENCALKLVDEIIQYYVHNTCQWTLSSTERSGIKRLKHLIPHRIKLCAFTST